MKNAIYAGSFDPFTNGHLHVLKQASKVFDKVYVAIAVNSAKSRRTDKDEMKAVMERIFEREEPGAWQGRGGAGRGALLAGVGEGFPVVLSGVAVAAWNAHCVRSWVPYGFGICSCG